MFQEFESIKFSKIISHNSDACASFSPGGLALAYAAENQLYIWNIGSKEISQLFVCDHAIDFIEWSPDSELIYCIIKKENLVQVWNLNCLSWRGRINEGCLAITHASWAPDSRHILILCEFHVSLKIWSITSETCVEIESPKPIENCFAFSSCGKYFIVANRPKLKDYLSVYACDTWQIIKNFPVDTKDLSSIQLSSVDLVIGVIDALVEYKILFYSIDGRLLGKYTKEGHIGPYSLSWNPTGKLVAVGDIGGITLLQSLDYKLKTSCQNLTVLGSENIVLYNKSEKSDMMNSSNKFASRCEIYDVIKRRPISILQLLGEIEKPDMKQTMKTGVHILQFSSDGQYLAFVHGLCWHPKQNFLIICTGSDTLNMWTPNYCICFMSPYEDKFSIIKASWHPKEDFLILNSKECSSLLYLPGSF
ncbi:WD repeat-containing protein WRAP73-like isoform X2 [Stegodyphus dumicola]|uniref:WD repeat-containing protein WRAP73-like isoform X2 n=1 Tax=Stegodyphus dumicola TaxID=202533 RepID=UPI0015AEC272|nr:WD repeat-containing protein WRAP73-like isoform X2 [Stegodyphus dumicola]